MLVLFSHKIPSIAEEILKKEGFKTIVEEVESKQDLILKLEEYNPEILICLLTDKIDADVIKASNNLRIISTYSVGFNHIDLEFAKKRGVRIIHTPGVLTKTVAEHTVGLLLAVMQKIVPADSFTRQKLFKGWEPLLFLGDDLYNKTVGIIGAGRIGTEVAKIIHNGFGAKIVYTDVKQNSFIEQVAEAKYMDLEDMLSVSDIVSVHVPLLPQTKHLLNAEKFKIMKNNAIIINTSRGPVIKEDDLVNALVSGKLKAAGLDVFENEPEIHPKLIEMENVVLTPHIASASIETREKMAKMVADGIIKIVKGESSENELKLNE